MSLVPDEPVDDGGVGRDDDDEALDDGSVAYDLDSWTSAQRDALELLLTGREIPHDWSGDHVVVPAARADEVDDLLDGLGPEPPPPGAAQVEAMVDVGVASAAGPEHVVAGPGRRLIGAVVDGAVATAVASALSVTLLPGDDAALAVDLTMAAVIAAYTIVSVALWGRTIGKLVAGTRVVAVESGAIPGWSPAGLRWAVASIVAIALLPLGDEGLAAVVDVVVGAAVTIYVYIGILRDPLRQGVHDKVAGTVVVLEPRPGGHAQVRSGDSSVEVAPPPAP